jgi:hypothetical protein
LKTLGFISASIFSISILTGCSAAGEAITPAGQITIPAMAFKGDETDGGRTMPGDPCFFGTDGNPYPDVDAGAQVTLRDSTGATVGLANLTSAGHLFGWDASQPKIYSSSDNFTEDFCVFEFKFEPLQSDDTFFSVEVASRGQVNFERDALSFMVLSLGD